MPEPTSTNGKIACRVTGGDRLVQVIHASIVDLPSLDALVSSDDSLLSHGGGVSRALWRAGGRELAEAVGPNRPALRLGDVHVSPAGRLRARVVLHAVTVDLVENRTIGPAEIGRLFRHALVTAERLECASVGLPLLGSGAAGIDREQVIAGFLNAIEAWFDLPSCLHQIVLAVVDDTSDVCAGLEGMIDVESVDGLVQVVRRQLPAGEGARLDAAWQALVDSPAAGKALPAVQLFVEVAFIAVAAALRAQENAVVGEQSDRDAVTAWLAPRGLDPRTNSVPGLGATLRALPVGETLELLRLARSAADRPLGSGVWARLCQALMARNRLAHDAQQAFEDVDVLMSGTKALLGSTSEFLQLGPASSISVVDEQESAQANMEAAETLRRSSEAEQPQPVFDLDDRPAAPRSPRGRASSRNQILLGLGFADTGHAAGASRLKPVPPSLVPPAPVAPPSGTTHVRRLHEFLLEHLPEDARQAIDARLTQEGYEGSSEMRLLEHCVRVEDVAQFLADEFANVQLVRLIERVTGRKAGVPAPSRELAERLLTHFGFPRPEGPEGLAAAHAQIRDAIADIRLGVGGDLSGVVGPVARRLEYICKVLLRFVTMAAYREAPEMLLRECGHLREGETLNRCALGRLFELVEALAERLAADESPEAQIFERDFRSRRLFPAGTGSMPSIRNSFVHFKEEDVTTSPVAWKARALRFLEDAAAFLDYLGRPDTRVFPRLVLVKEIRIDRWGRRVAHGVDDEGRKELIFTDTALDAGRVYFMHPLTNPLRVDPILVPAGDLVWVETG